MSNYNELKTISKKYVGKEAYSIASELDISIFDEPDCIKVFKDNSPLVNRDAVLVTLGGRYIIYCKESNYKEYYILHELCHYILKHNADGEYEESQSNILACMILISNKDLHKSIFTLSSTYNIPTYIIYNYIAYIEANTSIFKRKKVLSFVSITLSALFLFSSGTFIGNCISYNNIPNTTPALTFTEVTTEQPTFLTTQTQFTSTEVVYITKYGSKYHKSNCYYIRKSDIISLIIGQAQNQGYTPCAVCFNN